MLDSLTIHKALRQMPNLADQGQDRIISAAPANQAHQRVAEAPFAPANGIMEHLVTVKSVKIFDNLDSRMQSDASGELDQNDAMLTLQPNPRHLAH